MEERLAKANEHFEAFLKERGMRRTAERSEILRKALEFDGHFDIERLKQAMDEEGFHVSLATVYNTVDLMYESGILRKHVFDGQQARFEVAADNHLHLVCLQCGKICEVSDRALFPADADMPKRLRGFHVSYYSATFYGLCNACARKNRQVRNRRIKKQ